MANPRREIPHPNTTAHPLSHHEIIRLIEPFTRGGRRVDLAETDRLKRCLVFKPVEHGSEHGGPLAGICETMQLENPRPGLYRLTRSLTLAGGFKATLRTEGAHPADLLDRIEKVPPQRQFRPASGVIIALSYRLVRTAGSTQDKTVPIQMLLTRGEVEIEGLTLSLDAVMVSDSPIDISVTPKDGHVFALPDDLLAVLGREWGILRKRRTGWRGSLRVRGSPVERSRKIEVAFERMVTHLAETFANPPLLFHETLRLARWRVVFRRAIPLLTVAAVAAIAEALSHIEIREGSIIPFLIFAMPPILLFSAFMTPNRPPLEIPSLPRRLDATTWRQPPAAHRIP